MATRVAPLNDKKSRPVLVNAELIPLDPYKPIHAPFGAKRSPARRVSAREAQASLETG